MTNQSKIAKRFQSFLEVRKDQDVEAQITEAEQIVHAIGEIDSHYAFHKVQGRIQKQKGQMRFLNVFIRTAAVLFIPLLITSILIFSHLRIQSASDQFSVQKISNPSGIRSEIVLPDGSSVWLNAESTISYRIPFTSKGRNVTLTGEAFFDVKKDKKNPFRVESGKVYVTVLGTRFNYKAFPEDPTVEVTLEEGKVKLNSTSSKTGKEITLKPGERAVINKMNKQTNITAENIEKYIGWHEGKLIFDNTPLSKVAVQLERWFGVEVKITDPQILAYRISTTFNNESLHQILNMLELASPIKISTIPAKYEKTTQIRSKENVIIKSKN